MLQRILVVAVTLAFGTGDLASGGLISQFFRSKLSLGDAAASEDSMTRPEKAITRFRQEMLARNVDVPVRTEMIQVALGLRKDLAAVHQAEGDEEKIVDVIIEAITGRYLTWARSSFPAAAEDAKLWESIMKLGLLAAIDLTKLREPVVDVIRMEKNWKKIWSHIQEA